MFRYRNTSTMVLATPNTGTRTPSIERRGGQFSPGTHTFPGRHRAAGAPMLIKPQVERSQRATFSGARMQKNSYFRYGI